jgi:hypothetical protein
MGTPGHLNGHPWALEMGNLRSLKREPSRARSCSLWCQTSHSLVTDCCHTWSENGHPCVARTLWSWDLATPGSERASSRLDLAPSESSLLQCQKFRSRGYICAPPLDCKINVDSWGILQLTLPLLYRRGRSGGSFIVVRSTASRRE